MILVKKIAVVLGFFVIAEVAAPFSSPLAVALSKAIEVVRACGPLALIRISSTDVRLLEDCTVEFPARLERLLDMEGRERSLENDRYWEQQAVNVVGMYSTFFDKQAKVPDVVHVAMKAVIEALHGLTCDRSGITDGTCVLFRGVEFLRGRLNQLPPPLPYTALMLPPLLPSAAVSVDDELSSGGTCVGAGDLGEDSFIADENNPRSANSVPRPAAAVLRRFVF